MSTASALHVGRLFFERESDHHQPRKSMIANKTDLQIRAEKEEGRARRLNSSWGWRRADKFCRCPPPPPAASVSPLSSLKYQKLLLDTFPPSVWASAPEASSVPPQNLCVVRFNVRAITIKTFLSRWWTRAREPEGNLIRMGMAQTYFWGNLRPPLLIGAIHHYHRV